MSLVISINNFENIVLESLKPVLLDFWATWCGPCSMLSPIIDEISKENPDILVGKINVDEEPELTEKFGIESIPTVIAMKNGKILNQSIGLKSKEELLLLFN